jgi:ribonuclease E
MRKFMSKRMLIDAAHPEQTRVAVIDGNRVEEFDFESQSKKQLRGNIYLAKITRVEASLQAAFVDYGGNRHGFLAFNEIHPDYYQIPVKDREELLRLEEEEEKAAEAEEADAQVPASDEADEDAETGIIDADSEDEDEDEDDTDVGEEAAIAAEAAARRRRRRVRELRRYKIQEVIKPGQVLLAQVSKEERGNKGAALTTYLSLAGRYCVLMPNTARGGGISRKISNAADRKRLKSVTEGLELPKGVGLIIRTAGSKRTKVEIKRDYEYLGRLWGTIRENTLTSMAPALVHEEGGLVRRAVRDLYDKDIEDIYVEGESAYHDAHDFMKMLMPSHAARVKQYKGPFPIFLKHQVEAQLEAIYDPNVRLKSGGYLVIHQTEALVAVDVNSGRSTKERNIEATALKTNLEAADEACRQMRLRDLAGLLVIDFIDMDENKNIRAVEKRMKDALKRDRARVQMGRISSFGLMELSRQRRRASVIEGSSQVCPTCDGIGVVRSIESAALSALQAVEGEAMKGQTAKARLTIPTKVALYLLNEKRDFLASMERELDLKLLIDADSSMHPPKYEIEVLERRKGKARHARKAEQVTETRESRETDTQSTNTDVVPADASTQTGTSETSEGAPKKRRRGRRGGRGRRRNSTNVDAAQTQQSQDVVEDNTTEVAAPQEHVEPTSAAPETPAKPRRRRRKSASAETTSEAATPAPEPVKAEAEEKPKRPVRRRRKPASAETAIEDATPAPEVATTEAEEKPKRPVRRRRKPASAETTSEAATPAPEPVKAEAEEKPKRPARRRRKPANAEAAPAEVAPASEMATTEAEEKPKRPVRRRRKPASAETATQDATPSQEPVKTEAAEKPKRPVRRRRKPASAETATEDATPAQEPAAAEAEAGDKPKRPVRRRRKPANAASEQSAQPSVSEEKPSDTEKKGWWAKRFKA